MSRHLSLPLAISLIMLPQFVETVYSPALPSIAAHFNVAATMAGQTLSIYFVAFALGVIVWGRLCDQIGRRPALLSGLAVYGIATCLAACCQTFSVLLGLRALAAFGLAAASIVTQTALRDQAEPKQLKQVFAGIGIAMALSPAIGFASGAWLIEQGGLVTVLWMLAGLALVQWIYVALRMPETQPTQRISVPCWLTLRMMLRDRHVVGCAMLIACFNLSLFALYQLAPFVWPSTSMHQVGGLIGIGVLLGSLINQAWLTKDVHLAPQLMFAISLHGLGALLLCLFDTPWSRLLMLVLITMAYAIAIPNILAQALRNYQHVAGTAGALLGGGYYSLLGFGLILTSATHNLATTLIVNTCVLVGVAWLHQATRTKPIATTLRR
ncbi:MAG: MFS transporter [Shewanellaceae bacterium]|nr:MFS transporter [Shewanellaceae bacterium]